LTINQSYIANRVVRIIDPSYQSRYSSIFTQFVDTNFPGNSVAQQRKIWLREEARKP
jgi:hypothetical protein